MVITNRCSCWHSGSYISASCLIWTAMIAVFVSGILISQRAVQAELFTSTVDYDHLLDIENTLVNELRSYVQQETLRLTRITRFADELQEHWQESNSDRERYLLNPVYNYLFVKRLSKDWRRVVDNEILNNKSKAQLPTNEDLTGAGDTLLRLQDTYELTVEQVANGGVYGSPRMTAGDCYQLGLIPYGQKDYRRTALWMNQALRIYDDEVEKSVSKARILEYAQYSSYMLGHLKHALNFTYQWLEIEPTNTIALKNQRYYEHKLAKEVLASFQDEMWKASGDILLTTSGDRDNLPASDVLPKRSADSGEYQRLCRGEQAQPVSDRLTCRYVRHKPMFFIRPIKEELLHNVPRIAIYHDVMTKSEIDTIVQLAKPKLKRANVADNSKNSTLASRTSNVRLSKSAWLTDQEHEILKRINERSSAVTGLSLETAEQLQVLNYGIGGHYEPHHDFFTEVYMKKFPKSTDGNRMATLLCYATDVTAGGATVFPELGVTVWPELFSPNGFVNAVKSLYGLVLLMATNENWNTSGYRRKRLSSV